MSTLGDRICDYLAGEWAYRREQQIAAAVGAAQDEVCAELRRLAAAGRVSSVTDRNPDECPRWAIQGPRWPS
jgi:hypothetical protein